MYELLKKRFPSYEIVELDEDFWDIVNPFGKANIGVYEEKIFSVVLGEEWRPSLPSRMEYVIHFDAQHRHFDELEAAFEYVESIMNDEVCAVEFRKHEILRMCGEIDSSELADLRLEKVLQSFSYDLANTEFSVRSFSGKHDINGRIEEADGKLTLIME
jgi:hypothetical protein